MADATYFAYLLRLWRESEKYPWRVMLENPHTGEQAVFASLLELVVFLEKEKGNPPRSRKIPPGLFQKKSGLE